MGEASEIIMGTAATEAIRIAETFLPRASRKRQKELACLAAFNLSAAPHAQMKVYETIRTLQLLDRAAIEAGILA